jgi:hypothetical protein
MSKSYPRQNNLISSILSNNYIHDIILGWIRNYATNIHLYISRNCYIISQSNIAKFRVKIAKKIRETCQFGCLDPGNVSNQIGQPKKFPTKLCEISGKKFQFLVSRNKKINFNLPPCCYCVTTRVKHIRKILIIIYFVVISSPYKTLYRYTGLNHVYCIYFLIMFYFQKAEANMQI